MRGRERGAGSVLIIGIVLAVTIALMVAAVLSSGVSARRRAAVAADLAAVAAAGRLAEGSEAACATAEKIAAANGGAVRHCVVHGLDVEVQVRVGVTGPGAAWLPDQDRRARAGPDRVPQQ